MMSSGSAVVAMSTSLTGRSISALRTAPPTTRASTFAGGKRGEDLRNGFELNHEPLTRGPLLTASGIGLWLAGLWIRHVNAVRWIDLTIFH